MRGSGEGVAARKGLRAEEGQVRSPEKAPAGATREADRESGGKEQPLCPGKGRW
jgi:hypothetical protein